MTNQPISTIDLRVMIENHVRRGTVSAPELDRLTPQELLDAFAIASEEYGLAFDLFDSLDLSPVGGPADRVMAPRYQARLDRATELRRRARELLLALLNPPPA